MLLQIDEREHELLLEVLGSALHPLHEIDTAGYEAMRQEREAVLLSLRDRLVAPNHPLCWWAGPKRAVS